MCVEFVWTFWSILVMKLHASLKTHSLHKLPPRRQSSAFGRGMRCISLHTTQIVIQSNFVRENASPKSFVKVHLFKVNKVTLHSMVGDAFHGTDSGFLCSWGSGCISCQKTSLWQKNTFTRIHIPCLSKDTHEWVDRLSAARSAHSAVFFLQHHGDRWADSLSVIHVLQTSSHHPQEGIKMQSWIIMYTAADPALVAKQHKGSVRGCCCFFTQLWRCMCSSSSELIGC